MSLFKALSGFPSAPRPTDNPVPILLFEFMWEVGKNNLSTLIPGKANKDSLEQRYRQLF